VAEGRDRARVKYKGRASTAQRRISDPEKGGCSLSAEGTLATSSGDARCQEEDALTRRGGLTVREPREVVLAKEPKSQKKGLNTV